MKFKSIIACGAILLGVGSATTSCEDMFTADNALVEKNLAPQDTLYQFMGIVKSMQKVAERTVLLGELRADLVDIDPAHSTTDLQELAANNVSVGNAYNKPADYYAVINNCNVYLANVDSMKNSQGTRKYYEKEICSVKCFRAWCYLELVKNYGKVPLVTEPVLDSETAEDIVTSGNKSDMKAVLDYFINDLAKYQYMDENQNLRQSYGKKSYGTYVEYSKFSIPVRVLLAEMYLWRGSFTNDVKDYEAAIGLYHDYFTFPSEEVNTSSSSYSSYWMNIDFNSRRMSYSVKFDLYSSVDKNYEAVIPMDTTSYYGNTSNLNAVFTSTYGNNYYPAAAPSERMKTLSKSQIYCLYNNPVVGEGGVFYGDSTENSYRDKDCKGDLRYSSVYTKTSNFYESQYNSNVNPMKYYIEKYGLVSTDRRVVFVPLYRKDILYLHLAEALNRANFPETAFAILKYGLSYYTLNDRSIISQDEFDRLCEIKTKGFSLAEPKYEGEMSAKANSSFVVWPSTKFYTLVKDAGKETPMPDADATYQQLGIHSFGSGDSDRNEYYTMYDETTRKEYKALRDRKAAELEAALPELPENPTGEEQAAYDEAVANAKAELAQTLADYLATPEVRARVKDNVAKLILEEEALEGAFEGYRFYDIMRYQMQEKGGEGIGTTITMPAHFATENITYKFEDTGVKKYGTTPNMEGKPWYLPLPTR